MPDKPRSEVAEFFRGRSVLVTGATGFLGKALLEKLLRSCPDVDTVYVLLRGKHGMDAGKRLDALTNDVVFSRLRSLRPDFARHFRAVAGDVGLPGLGIDNQDVDTLRRDVTVVFHCAASVRFDDNLRAAVTSNVVGTYHLLQFTEGFLHKLQAFVHVSTSFCHCDQPVLEEKLYPSKADPEKIMDIVSWMDDELLNVLTPKLLGNLPNTYSLSKNLTEQLVANYASKLPISIARPSIVIPSWKEPLPGWADNTNGPVGLLVAAGKGIQRSMHGDPEKFFDCVPVDFCANAIIVLARHVAENRPPSPYVCNVSSARDNPVTWDQVLCELKRLSREEYPLEGGLWYPGGNMRPSAFLHTLCILFFHFLPAYIVDFAVLLSGKKPFLVRVQKKLQFGHMMLHYYTLHEWLFINKNLHALADSLSPEDRETFYFDFSDVDIPEFFKNAIIGTKVYILKEDLANLPTARKHMRRLYWLSQIATAVFYMVLLWVLYLWSEPLVSCLEFMLTRLAAVFQNAPVVRVLAEDVAPCDSL